MFGRGTDYLNTIIKLSEEDLKAAARELALCKIRRGAKADMSLMNIQAVRKDLAAAYRQLRFGVRSGLPLPVCMHTLMENHYIVDKSQAKLSDVGKSLSRSRFTVLERGKKRGVIRAYAIATAVLESRNFSVDYSILSSYLTAFQEISPLDEGELILLPDMLKVACIMRAGELYNDVNELLKEYMAAQRLYKKLSEIQSERRADMILDMAIEELSVSGYTRFSMILSENDEFINIEKFRLRLDRLGINITDEAGKDRTYQLGLSELAVNIAGTLRFIDSLNTDKLMEDFSMLGKILGEDKIYNEMDIPSKRAYSALCNDIACKLKISQAAVARAAQKLSGDEHLGHFLIDEVGRKELIESLGGKVGKRNNRNRLFAFIVPQVLLTVIAALLCTLSGIWQGVMAVLPIFVLVNSVVVRCFCSFTRPVPVPRIACHGIAPEKTVVAVSVLITDEKSLTGSIERLEAHYFSGNMKNTYYVILGDFKDSKSGDISEEEAELLNLADVKIKALNKKYSDGEDIFYFLHRKRTFNQADGVYMGYERKRGAIMCLFELIRSGGSESFKDEYCFMSGDLPKGIRYALLLDSDTVLPKDALSQMLGAAVHPQCRAVIKDGKIEKGYGIFIPRMENLPGENTDFMRLHSGTGGISAYSSPISNFYHDNFSEAVFGGKGLVDIEAFCECLKAKIDENTVLSHDMLESCFVKSAFLSDIILYDSEPAKLFSWWKREHRWIRGDWQLLPYLFAKKGSKKYVTPLSKWKIIDNLRRSLTPIAIALNLWLIPFLGFGWGVWLSIAAALAEPIIALTTGVWGAFRGGRLSRRMLGITFGCAFLDFMCIPYAAARSLDAIIRTLYRVLRSHKRMLEWQTAAQGEKLKSGNVLSYYIKLWMCVALGVWLFIMPLFGLHGSVILGVLFLYAPFAMYASDSEYKEELLPDEMREYYLQLARDIWGFFENETNSDLGYIPPDNIQVYPNMPSVYNASPTNIGMGIMAAVCARDLGFIGDEEFIERLTVTVEKIKSFDKWNGHLYNWYDIESGQRLEPAYVSTVDSGNLCACLLCAAQALDEIEDEKAKGISEKMRKIVYDTDFSALFDYEKSLFYIGYDITRCTLTQAWYDLLSSEARLTYIVACGLGKVPQKAWQTLGRVLIHAGKSLSLISWSGTMFEYLMPVIFTGLVRDTLMDEACRGAVDEHMLCSDEKPWGISESGYYAFDRSMYYQYRAFGAKALGLAPMKEHEDVRAAYAGILAGMIYPKKAYENLLEYEKLGVRGKYGFYEAVDFTEGRVQSEHNCEVVKSFMAHHQGMSICSLNNILNSNIIVKRFSAVPEMKTVMLYNAEKMPDTPAPLKQYERMIMQDDDTKKNVFKPIEYKKAGRYPRGIFLTGGEMTAFFTDSDVSYIKLRDIYITRFRNDYIRGKYGLKLYLRSGERVYCINTYDREADVCNMSFTYESYRMQTDIGFDGITIKTETIILQNEDVLRIKISMVNHTDDEKAFEIGAFSDISLAKMSDDMAHPAFVRLTVDAAVEDDMLIFRRRGTKKREDIYACATIEGGCNNKFSADGLSTPGRLHSYVEAMHSPMHTDLRIKSPVEPVMCIRNEFRLAAGASRDLYFILGASNDKEKVKQNVKSAAEGDFTVQRSLSFAMEMSALHFMRVSGGKANLYTNIISRLILGIKSKQNISRHSTLLSSELYKYSISGDIPIVMVEIINPTHFRTLKVLLSLLKYAVYKGEAFDLVIVGRYENSYRCDVKSYITDVVSSYMIGSTGEENKHIHLIDAYSLTDEEDILIRESADVIIDSERALAGQFADEEQKKAGGELCKKPINIERNNLKRPDRKGYFTDDGEYVFTLSGDENTPLPWSNIICNPYNEGMGTLVTESGGGYTWYGNCHDRRLTQWYCDAMHDTQGEILLISDREGNVRSVCHSRIQGNSDVVVRHGFGYTVFENDDALCKAKMTVFTDTDAPQKLTLLELINVSEHDKRLTLKYMIDRNDIKGAFVEFSEGIAFIRNTKLSEAVYTAVINVDSVHFSADREAELLFYDAGERKNTCGFSCLTCEVTLRANEKRDLVFILGMASREKAFSYVKSMTAANAHEKLMRIKNSWKNKLSKLTVKTPDEAFNSMVNGRLLYQVYAARLMGRTGFYQSGGAFGFRDQLQDILALLYTDSERAKGQILLCASMQYEKGDVLHWWHSPASGVRTKISDDRLFLPFVCSEYARVTGDFGIFDIRIPYLENEEIPEGRDDIYYNAKHSDRDGSLYEHCMKAIECTCDVGVHGLPLMGAGDWNDGMDKVGKDGGESVFLAFFLIVTIEKFMHICTKRNDADGYKFLKNTVLSLRQATEEYAWDGDWFRRAYYSDGTPLGSKENDECMIDLLTQCWGVFAERKRSPEKCKKAMESVKKLLRDDEGKLIKLLTPPFSDNNNAHNAGYIESYVEGVRENGGQYTHAAIWYLIAQCMVEDDAAVMETVHLLNPSEKDVRRYMVEPYVMPADIYAIENASGRGGWTWYTGSAAWSYVAAVKYIIGMEKRGDRLIFKPHNTWDKYTVTYKYGVSTYNIYVEKGDESKILVDDEEESEVLLKDDGKTHCIKIFMNPSKAE